MRIVQIEIENFRGIGRCLWNPSPDINCLIGPGDSTKTTILDAIELCLTPKSNFVFDDADIFDLDSQRTISITLTLVGLPTEFVGDDRYGLYLRGWNEATHALEDELADGLQPALSIRVMSDEALEARWSLFNDRIAAAIDDDPPTIRYKDAQLAMPVRLGPYAERHLGWGRQSVLSRLDARKERVGGQLVAAARAAREAFQKLESRPFKKVVEEVERLARSFSVPVRRQYLAALDLQNISLSTGGIALHDGTLPLRRLGTGSARLLVAAIQRGAGADAPVALIDEIEHGLEPHRIARLVQYLREPGADAGMMQSFVTTHSVVTVREMKARELFCVRAADGTTSVVAAAALAGSTHDAQRHFRGNPDAFLAQRVVVCEGRTEHGMCRGLDAHWTANGEVSFAQKGVIAVEGGGTSSLPLAEHLLALGHDVFVILDSDKPADPKAVARVKAVGGTVLEWPDQCCIETRILLDVPWNLVIDLLHLAASLVGDQEKVQDAVNARFGSAGLAPITSLSPSPTLDSEHFRRLIGLTAHKKKWFKNVSAGEDLAGVVAPHLAQLRKTPLGLGLDTLRSWVDG